MGALIFGTTTIQGRKFDKIKLQTSKAGVPRQIIFGRVKPVIGNIIATTPPKIVKKKQKQKSGKGSGKTEVVNEEVYRTYAIRICEGPITGICKVWRNNELVYDRDSNDATQIENNQGFWEVAEFFLGGFKQMPSAVMQAAFGVNNVHGYRGTCYMVIDNENLTSTGGAIPQYAFEVERSEGFVLTSKPYPLEAVDALSSEFTGVRPTPNTGTTDNLASQLVSVSGDIRTVFQQYDQGTPEAIDSHFAGISGALRSVLNRYELEVPESINASFAGVSGDLRLGLITYNGADHELITSTFLGITGDLQ